MSVRDTYTPTIKQDINLYVEALILEDPNLYASDGSNNRIVRRYFKDVYNIDVSDKEASIVHSLTRSKSKFLEENPEYDKRDKEKGKKTEVATWVASLLTSIYKELSKL